MQALADSLELNTSCTTITLRRRDLDVLQRYAQAAAHLHVFTNNGVTYWRRFTLRANPGSRRSEQRLNAQEAIP